MKSIINKNQFIALFIALFAVTAFNACSDVAGPDNGSDITAEEYNKTSNFSFGDLGSNGFGSDAEEEEIVDPYCIVEKTAILKASKQSIETGQIIYSMDSDNLYVSYVTFDGYGITETHLWAGTNMDDMPQAGNGAPKNGHFPYGDYYSPFTTNISYTIPLDEVGIEPGDDIYIVAHAVVGEINGNSIKKTETAYAGDKEGDSKRWFWYIHSESTSDCVFGGTGGTD